MEKDQGIKKGYLHNDFKLFHLRDKKNIQFEHHYHDFNKIIIFIFGDVMYNIEGKSYKLKPWDVLFVPSNQVHKPIIEPEQEYERIVIWINNAFLEQHSRESSNLLTCFNMARGNRYLVRLRTGLINYIKTILAGIEKEMKNPGFGSGILCNALFVQFMVHMNRLQLNPEMQAGDVEVEFDEQIQKIIHYINNNLSSDLSVETVSKKFYINKFYLMHKFKENTGFTMHTYINSKRLQKCTEILKSGKSPSDAANECGFNDYSSFVRAFTKMYGIPPKKYSKFLLNNAEKNFQVEG